MPSNLPAAASRQTVTLPPIPELHDPNFLDVLLPVKETSPQKSESSTLIAGEDASKNLMMDALKGTAHQTLTQNLAPTYDSTGSPTLDAFQFLASEADVKKHLDPAWAEDPELTLRIIWNLRSIHDGKGNKEAFYRAFGWLYEHHPRTAIVNLRWLVEPVCTTPKSKVALAHGCWKDLLNILALATLDELHKTKPSFLHSTKEKYKYNKDPRPQAESKDPAARVAASLAKDAENKQAAAERRHRIAAERYENLTQKLSQPKFRALYIAIARLFADRLAQDIRLADEIKALNTGDSSKELSLQISLAGKWAPTPMCAHDRVTNIATAIPLLLRQAQTPARYPSALDTPLDPAEAAIILRSFYQRSVLTRLRAISAVPEPLMSAKRWNEIKYNRVPSVCMKRKTELFFKNDPAGFKAYLTHVESGRKTISGATLFPHELLEKALELGEPLEVEEGHEFATLAELRRSLKSAQIRVVEAQWKTLVARLRESGSLDNALAVCDVSGSMGSVHAVGHKRSKWDTSGRVHPILPAISLSLVLAHLAKPPFNAGFVTFSSSPQFIQLDLEKPLYETVHEMVKTPWEMNTDLHAVFVKLLLPLAVKNKVPQEDMIKRLFVFSDMQFDACTSADAADWQTNHDAIERAYKEAGYEVPQIVYWDLAKFGTVEVQAEREGVALMNGFSPAMLKVFMGDAETEEEWEEVVGEDGEAKTVKVSEEFNPVSVMKKAVMTKSFDGLVVVD
ncbi:hypothetical protein H0H81_002182 [Sphagnurus paluster]|uniref:Uncharacterized protein n=1 Tax=Sphagnurus paluster TaxID=117069 RepID=A0A9P7KLU6_9AGAR|nr:hypothetical protein H0H81_002182 [Sphagnurus paluster]